jgi:hypothetical protein
VNPGVIDTPFREAFSESMKNFAENDSYWSGGKAIECANVIVFLASDAASYVVGDSIEVNGGQLMLYLLSPALDGTNHMNHLQRAVPETGTKSVVNLHARVAFACLRTSVLRYQE